MSVKEDFLAIQKEQEDWVDEFLKSPNASQLSDYQRENLEKMVLFLVTMAKTNEAYPNTWTGEKVVDLVVNHICKMLPEEADFFDAYPETMALFFSFLAEKKYLPKGKEIGQSLIAAKADIFQTEEQKNRLEQAITFLQDGIDEGLDFSSPKAVKNYFEKKAKESKIIDDYFEKKDAGIPITEIMEQMTPEERDILVKDMYKDVDTEFDMMDAEKGLEILERELAKGKSLEEATQSIPEALIPSVIGLLRPNMMGDSNDLSFSSTPIAPYKRKEKKVGRNAPCPCGSGKKYKRCCFRK